MSVINFAESKVILEQMRSEKAANTESGKALRSQLTGKPLHGNLDSSDDWDLYHAYETKEKTWEVWLPYDNAAMITFEQENDARDMARTLNRLLGEGKALYTGSEPTGPSYA